MNNSKKAETNRQNSQKSTGPKSMDGKVKSSRNSRIHGLLAKTVIFASEEERAEFEGLHRSLWDSEQPRNGIEVLIVDEIATCAWKLARVQLLQEREFRRRMNPEVRGVLDQFVKDSDLKPLPIPGSSLGMDATEDPWQYQEVILRVSNRRNENEDRRDGSSERDGVSKTHIKGTAVIQREQNGNADHTEMEIRMTDKSATIARYEASIKRDLYRAIHMLRTLRGMDK